MRKIAQKIHFLALEVDKTTSRCFFGQKSIFPKNDIFYFWIINFSRKILQALEKNFFRQNLKSSTSQLSYALSTVKKYLKLALLT